jgi:protein-disulfide isomerase
MTDPSGEALPTFCRFGIATVPYWRIPEFRTSMEEGSMRKFSLAALCLTITVLLTGVCNAAVYHTVKKRLKLESTPIDIKMSRGGSWLYVLTKEGDLRVYSYQGNFVGKFEVGKSFDQIEPGTTDEEVYLKSKKKKTIQIIDVTFKHAIETNNSPFKGNADAPVTIVEYTDFECPYCARLQSMFDELLRLYPNQLKIVYKNYPLRGHRNAGKAAAIVMAAHLKGDFWPIHNRLFENYRRLNDARLAEIRSEFGFDTPEFETLMNSKQVQEMIRSDVAQGKSIGVKGTPTVFINGKRVQNKSFEGLKQAIDQALAVIGKQ